MNPKHYKLNKKARKVIPVAFIVGAVFLLVLAFFTSLYFFNDHLDKSFAQGVKVGSDQQFDETPVSAEDINNYRVKPNMPRLIYIPELDVKARIFPVGLTTKNAIGSPANVNDAAWYNNSALPGSMGVSFIDAHSGSNQSKGIFTNINKLSKGDSLTVEMGDGKKKNFYVQSSEELKLEDVDMQKILTSKANSSELVLMSCAGRYDKKINTYASRYIVYLKM